MCIPAADVMEATEDEAAHAMDTQADATGMARENADAAATKLLSSR